MKKIFKIMSVCIAVAMVVLTFASCGGTKSTIKGKTGTELIKCMEVSANGKIIKIPFKVKDLESLGFKLATGKSSDVKVEKGGLSSGNVVFKNNGGDMIVALARNNTDKETALSNCIAFNVSTTSNKVSINGITPDTSTYEDVLAKLGKDIEERADKFEDEVKRLKGDSDNEYIMLSLSYSVPVSDENNKTIIYSMNIDIDEQTGKVRNVSIQQA